MQISGDVSLDNMLWAKTKTDTLRMLCCLISLITVRFRDTQCDIFFYRQCAASLLINYSDGGGARVCLFFPFFLQCAGVLLYLITLGNTADVVITCSCPLRLHRGVEFRSCTTNHSNGLKQKVNIHVYTKTFD